MVSIEKDIHTDRILIDDTQPSVTPPSLPPCAVQFPKSICKYWNLSPILKDLIDNSRLTKPEKSAAMHFVSRLWELATDKGGDGWVHMHHEVSRSLYGNRVYPKVVEFLKIVEAIEIDETYLSESRAKKLGKIPHSKSFRLKESFCKDVQKVPAIEKLQKRVDRMMERLFYAQNDGDVPDQRGRRWVRKTCGSVTFSPSISEKIKNKQFKTEDARKRAEGHLANVQSNSPHCKTDQKTGRLYYSVASLPKTIRAEILIDGEQTSEIDLCASQPTLLATLYPDGHPEKAKYLEAVKSPDFYESLGAGHDWSREFCKTKFFREIAYGSYYCSDRYELLPAFTKKFPVLAKIMEIIKRCGGNKVLPLKMQSLEASIMFEACDKCRSAQIKCLSVHDSLIVKTSDLTAAQQIFAETWESKTGIPARIKTSVSA